MMAEQASSSKAVSNTVEDALAPKAMKRKYTSSPKLLTPLKMTAERASSQRERLDVFQNEIIIAFADITSFKKFAQSKNGLCLDQAVIQTIVDDNERNEVEQKLGMLFKWQEIKGEKATAPKIRDLLQKYFRKDNPSDYLVLENGIFGLYKTVFLSKRSNVYLGVQISEISGTQTRAIKFSPKNKTNLREAQILVKLGNHVNVVSIIHAGIHRGDPHDYIYIAMERSWTQTVRNMLKECIKQEKPFHEFIAWSLVEQLMRAVEFLHSHNIIHRDLKPENILASDNWRHFKVTDFGLSKEIQDGFATNQTNANTGTEGYRSRETYDPNAKITAKADIFSAGVTIGEIMANGKHPFGNDKYLWSHHIINNKNLDLSHLCVSYKDQVTYFIKRMLEMDPEKRPTAKEVLNDVLIYFQAFQLKNQQTTAEESLGTTSKAITELSITEKEHLEDVFQDEIIKAFPDITGFKEFAQSKNGLYLDEHVIQQIVEDHKGSVEEQKLQMLQKWAENQEGKATVGKIRYLLQKYLGDQSSTGYIVLENGRYGMFKNYVLSKRAQVFLGQQISEVTGSYICAIKLQQNNSKNLKEAKILSKLRNHVNVVSILHAGIYRSDPYDYIFIAMELSWTDTVRDMLEESDRLAIPFNEFISMNLVKQILRALDFIHSNNIIHRDLKPENVLLSKDWSHSKVTDFGISKTITDGRSTRQTSENIGTDGYRAHETYITNVRISLKADIFSAGVTIAEIFSNGKHPFGSNPYLWSNNIINNQNLDLSHLCVSNKDQIISLIKRMLEVDPDQRPTSREVLNEVDKFQTLSQPKNQRTTADQSLAPASIAELLIKEKENVIIMFNYSDKHMYSISFKAKKWSRMQECDIDSYFGTAVVSGRHLYILQNQKVYQLEYSDPTAKWQQMSSMNEDHGEYPPVAVLNGFIYVCGGSGIYDASRSVHRYDPPLDRWEHMCDMNIIRTNSCVVASEDHIYCVGGWDGRSVERFDGRSVERFDERSNEWEFVKSAPRLVMDASAAVVKNWIYLADHEGLLCYDIQNDSWSEIETKEWSFVKGWLVKILAVDEKLYVIGRMTESSPITAIYLLKRENGQMTLIEEFNGKYLNLHACLAVELNLHAYLDQASYIFTAV